MAIVLNKQGKVLLFINRRGYAAALWCEQCQKVQKCPDCDKPYTLHMEQRVLRCHRCEAEKAYTVSCQYCHSQSCLALGQGTERLAQAMAERFPEVDIVQMDKDTCPTWATLKEKLSQIQSDRPQIIVATQMLVKSHNIPNLHMVVTIEVDKALFSKDYRAEEYLLQQMHQVSGRVGRDGSQSTVYIQTAHTEHAIWQSVAGHNYLTMAYKLLEKRQQYSLPPYSQQICLLLSGPSQLQLIQFAETIRNSEGLRHYQSFPAMPSLVAKMAKQYRVVLLWQTEDSITQRTLVACLRRAKLLQNAPKKISWELDLDPIDW